MSYNKDTDYQSKIDEAVKSGDYESAAKYEQSRNEKIDAENLKYEKTNRFSGWLDKTDYSNIIRNQISSGATKDEVAATLKKRVRKSSGTEGLSGYAYDDVYDAAIKYIKDGNSFSYQKKAPTFKNSYGGNIQTLLSELRNMKNFKYNPFEDDVYKYYKEEYTREGKRAMEDILGELASNTGGVASSYAASVAAQSLDYYNRKLTDKIPELYSDAYERYMDQIERKEKQAELLADMSEDEYSRFKDSLDQYNADRIMAFDAFKNGIDNDFRMLENKQKLEKEAREQFVEDRDYDFLVKKHADEIQENNDAMEQEAAQKEYEHGQDEIDLALKKWETMGYLDKESAEILGLPEGLHTADYDYKKAQQYNLYNR